MSYLSTKNIIEEGDTVILYISWLKWYEIRIVSKISVQEKDSSEIIEKENTFQTVYGLLPVSSLVGKYYGAKIKLSGGYLYLLRPTPELWTLSLSHRTQIIYTPDISIILFQLEVRPGSVVIEAGTGSGSLTHALARTVNPGGHVHTFEYHKERADVAIKEFTEHGLLKVLTVHKRDVSIDGFGDEMNHIVDAVFLDLPDVSSAISFIVPVFKKRGGRFVSFSPCVEQVQKTSAVLKTQGFVDINTIEHLEMEYNVTTRDLRTASIRQNSDTGNGCADTNGQQKLLTALESETTTGHTGFITYASFPPDFFRKLKNED